jgi:hypothetical protein
LVTKAAGTMMDGCSLGDFIGWSYVTGEILQQHPMFIFELQ